MKLPSFVRSVKGELDVAKVAYVVITVIVVAIIAGALMPTAVNTTHRYSDATGNTYINDVNISVGYGTGAGNWTTSMKSTWDAVPLTIILSGLLVFVAIVIKLSRQ